MGDLTLDLDIVDIQRKKMDPREMVLEIFGKIGDSSGLQPQDHDLVLSFLDSSVSEPSIEELERFICIYEKVVQGKYIKRTPEPEDDEDTRAKGPGM